MGKKVTRSQALQQDINTEMELLQIKAAHRSLSSNWYHYRYIWTLISELDAMQDRTRFFTMLDIIANKLNIKYSR